MSIPLCRHYRPEYGKGCYLDRRVPVDCRGCIYHDQDTAAEQSDDDADIERSVLWEDAQS
jgi:hypothetical protein